MAQTKSRKMLNDYTILSAEILYFKLVYEQKGMNKAARKVGQDSANISRMIARLESNLGAKLFARHKSGLSPTEWGEKLYLAISNAQDKFSEVILGMGNREKKIRIGLSQAIAYSHFSKVMIQQLLELNLTPEFFLRSSTDLIEMVKSRELDFTLVHDQIKFPGLVARRVSTENLALCSTTGKVQKNLLIHADMLGIERIIHSISYEKRWMINDYFVLAKFLSHNDLLMGILPESLIEKHLGLIAIRSLDAVGRITALTWPGSVGVELLRCIEK